MTVSIPDPRGTDPEHQPAGRTDTPASPRDRSPDATVHELDQSTETSRDRGTSRRDALREQSSKGQDASTGPSAIAEWITLAVSSLIVLALIGLTTYFYVTGSNAPATIEVEPRLAETYQAGSRFYLPLRIRNIGGETGEEIRIRVSVTDTSGRQEASEVMIAFLAGSGTSRAVAAFGSDPRQGQIEAVVVSYLEP